MDISGKLVVAAVTHTETRIWATDAHRGDKPEVVARPAAEHVHHHVHQEQTTRGHETNRFEHPYLEGVAAALAPAGQIAPVNYMAIIFAGIWGFLLWNEIPDFYSLIGFVFILLAIVLCSPIIQKRRHK